MTGQKRDRQADKIRRIMADRGSPARIGEDELERLTRHLRSLHNAGMTAEQMGEQSGAAKSNISGIISGKRMYDGEECEVGWARRDTYNALMAVRYEQPAPKNHGARVDPTSTRRRVQALGAIGFTVFVIAEHLEISRAAINRLQLGRAGFVHWDTREKIKAVYGKLECADPADYGIGKYGASRAKASATRNGYAPPMCWDDDTIDDPDAFPEWTGLCGTTRGYLLHLQHNVGVRVHVRPADKRVVRTVLCDPCSAARSLHKAEQGGGGKRGMGELTTAAIREYQQEHPDASAATVGTALGVSKRTVVRYRTSSKQKGLDT